MAYLERIFETSSESVTVPNPITWSGTQTFTGTVDLSGATVTGMTLSASVVAPDTTDGAALGSTSLMWSDLFLASGAVINFNADVTLTHAANSLTVAGGVVAISDATEASAVGTASVTTAGGLGVTKKIYLGTDLVMVGGDIDLSTAGTGTYDIILKDAVADALSIKRGSTDVIVFDTTTPRVTITPALTVTGKITSNGGIDVGAAGAGFDVTFYGDTDGSNFLWDQNGDTNGSLTLGTTGGSKGVDFTAYGATNGTSMQWDQSADGLVITSAGLNASSGRALKIDAAVAAPAHADGYGAIEMNANFSGAIAGPYAAVSSTWVNLAAGTTVVAGPMICTRNDGIYGPSGLTLTNAKMVIGGRMQFVIDDGANPGSLYLWSTNIYSNALTALFDINSIHDFGDTTEKSTGGIAIPFMKVSAGGEAPNTVYYLNLYTS